MEDSTLFWRHSCQKMGSTSCPWLNINH
jgi:hypothetical protein